MASRSKARLENDAPQPDPDRKPVAEHSQLRADFVTSESDWCAYFDEPTGTQPTAVDVDAAALESESTAAIDRGQP